MVFPAFPGGHDQLSFHAQPGIAFIEEALKTDRKRSTALLGFITAVGSGFVVYFSKDIKALDTLDFWVGTSSSSSWLRSRSSSSAGSLAWGGASRRPIKVLPSASPSIYKGVMKVITPVFLV